MHTHRFPWLPPGAAALEGVERAAYRNQRVAVAGIGVPSHEAIRQYLDDLAGLVDEHLEDFVVDLRLLDFRRTGGGADSAPLATSSSRAWSAERSNGEYAVFGELQQRVVIGLQSDHRFQIVFEPHQRIGERIQRIGPRCELSAGQQRRSAAPPIAQQIRCALQGKPYANYPRRRSRDGRSRQAGWCPGGERRYSPIMCLIAASSVVASPTTAVTRRRYSMLLSSVSPEAGDTVFCHPLLLSGEPVLCNAVQCGVHAQ